MITSLISVYFETTWWMIWKISFHLLYCLQVDGHLPLVETQEQEQIIKYLVYQHQTHGNSVWLGNASSVSLVTNLRFYS